MTSPPAQVHPDLRQEAVNDELLEEALEPGVVGEADAGGGGGGGVCGSWVCQAPPVVCLLQQPYSRVNKVHDGDVHSWRQVGAPWLVACRTAGQQQSVHR